MQRPPTIPGSPSATTSGLAIDSHYVETGGGAERLHLRRFVQPGAAGPAVLMIHGAVENGRIFYSASGKGLAPFLARQGFDVFVADLRGRGQSSPAVGPASTYGMTEILEEDFPAYFRLVEAVHGPGPVVCMAHSWGGVNLLAYLAVASGRHQIPAMVFWGSKRRIAVWNWRRLIHVELVWNRLCPWLIRRQGFLNARKYRIGSDNESARTHAECTVWVKTKAWKHWQEDLDYHQALPKADLPPVLYLSGRKDKILGHPSDVRRLAEETGADNYTLHLLGRANGHRHDYGHIDMLTHPEADQDQFPYVLDWLRQYLT